MDKECCPKFNPEKWDKKNFRWENKLFIKESVPTFFHMPFPPMIGLKISKMMKMLEESGVAPINKNEVLILFTDPHPFKSEIYLSVSKDVAKANNAKISGEFFSRVFEGKYNKVPVFMKEMNKYLEDQKKKVKKYYIHYAYCPKCERKYGNNYMVIFAQI